METKRIFRHLALILCLSFQFAANAQERRSGPTTSALSAEQIARQSLPSVVLIVCDNGAGDTALGSGFFVTPNVVVTNYHVIEGMVQGKVRSAVSNNKKENWVVTSILNFDEESDLALLRVPEASKSIYPSSPLHQPGIYRPGALPQKSGIPLDTVSTTCGSGWVRSVYACIEKLCRRTATHPPATAGGTDRVQQRIGTFEAKPRPGKRSTRLVIQKDSLA